MVPSVSCVLSVRRVLNGVFGQLCAVFQWSVELYLRSAVCCLTVCQWRAEWCLWLAVCCLSVEH